MNLAILSTSDIEESCIPVELRSQKPLTVSFNFTGMGYYGHSVQTIVSNNANTERAVVSYWVPGVRVTEGACVSSPSST